MTGGDQGLLIGLGVFFALGLGYNALEKRRSRSKKLERLTFFDFWIQQGHQCSLDAALNIYIKQYGLAVRFELNEPDGISLIRTKVFILSEMLQEHPEFADDNATREIIEGWASVVIAYDEGTPNFKKGMAKRFFSTPP